ncbi:MAG: hypothetical protein JSS14_26270 [Proteobacteria bacterium]|nr:hypothetical protein [Pseudomonadota bacterium]
MHSAPSVSFPVGRSRMARRLAWGIWALGAAALLAWCVQFAGAPWRTAILASALALAARGAWAASRLGEGVQLRWDGVHWSCTGTTRLGGAGASIHLDLQSLVLVRLNAPGRPAAWLWLERANCPERWLDLRRALYARVPGGDEPVLSQP